MSRARRRAIVIYRDHYQIGNQVYSTWNLELTLFGIGIELRLSWRWK